MIDQIITLKALDRVVFNDDKEGVLGMRVARWLESPDEKGGVFIDANGRPTKVDAADNSGRHRRLPDQRRRQGRSSLGQRAAAGARSPATPATTP